MGRKLNISDADWARNSCLIDGKLYCGRWTSLSFKDVLSASDLAAFAKGGHGQRMGFGKRPAVIVIDMTHGFVDPAYALARGEAAAKAVPEIARLIAAARAKQVPVIYTIGLPRSPHPSECLSRKRQLTHLANDPKANEIVPELAPQNADVIIAKNKASAFFGTTLAATLVYMGVDTVIVTGATTSGCVRATVVDSASYNFFVIVPEECVADRAALSHQVNLIDMDMKYADVIPLAEVLDYFSSLQEKAGCMQT